MVIDVLGSHRILIVLTICQRAKGILGCPFLFSVLPSFIVSETLCKRQNGKILVRTMRFCFIWHLLQTYILQRYKNNPCGFFMRFNALFTFYVESKTYDFNV